MSCASTCAAGPPSANIAMRWAITPWASSPSRAMSRLVFHQPNSIVVLMLRGLTAEPALGSRGALRLREAQDGPAVQQLRLCAVSIHAVSAPGSSLRTRHPPSMIRLDNISKQHGQQILFIEASAALQRGEKVGLVGPNGAGKSTLFRMITGEEQPDEGQVSVDRGMTIGYFSQDVGEMAGRSVVAEAMDGAGPVSAVAAELAALERGARRSRPGRRDGRPDRALRRGAGALRGTRRLRARGPRARGPRRPRLQPGDDGRRRRRALGRLEDARRARAHPADAPRRHAARRAVEPPRPREPDLARERS